MPFVNFKGFKANAHANYKAMRKTMEKETQPFSRRVVNSFFFFFHWSTSLDKVTHKYVKLSLQFNTNKFVRITKAINDVKTKYHVI